MKIITSNLFITLLVFIASLSSCMKKQSTSIENLRVQFTTEPLAVEDKNPLFSWEMKSEVAGQKQTAYRIVVRKEKNGEIVWDSERVESDLSCNIRYEGSSLEPETEYSWELTVWDKDRKEYNKSSRYETGLMNPDISAWNGAQFIGTNRPILDATSACLFEITTDFQIIKGTSISLILGANDFRLNDRFQNIENVEGENYVRFELDVSGAGSENGSIIKIYRVGYGSQDSRDVPYKTVSAAEYPGTNLNDIITEENRFNRHNMSIFVDAGNITLKIDGIIVQTTAPALNTGFPGYQGGQRRERGSVFNISNYNTGNNYNTFPNLNCVGFASEPGDEVIFTNYQILNKGQSDPENNIVFGANTGATYKIFSGLQGVELNSRMDSIIVRNRTDKTLVVYADPSYGALTMVRTTFNTRSNPVEKAKLYVTSMGSYEFYINGKRVGNDWFAPGASQFRETLCYYAYDVTDLIKRGTNAMGALLIPGWYTGYMTFTPGNFNFFGDTEALLAKLVITYKDGTKDVLVTDPKTWKLYLDGPVRYGSFFQGERYDANKEENIISGNNLYGWTTAEYNDSHWGIPEIVRPRNWIDFDIVARYDKAVTIVETLQAQRVMPVHSDDRHTYTYDMGVNMVGVPSIKIPAGWLKKGDVLIFRYGEQVYPSLDGDDQKYIDMYGYNGKGKGIAGRILTENYRAALATDFYIAKDSKEVIYTPRTTYRGYQYIQITIPGNKVPLPLKNIKGFVLSSDNLPTGSYVAVTEDDTTGKMVNRLFRNIQRSQLGNFFTIPTDCPQRNERMGWTGDAQAYSRTATYNSDVYNFFRQWMVALRNDQGIGSETDAPGGIGSTVPSYNRSDDTRFPDGTTWAAAVCMVPWQLYTQYGSKQIIEENIGAMMQWLNGMDYYDFSGKYTYLSSKTTGLSDWLAMDSHTPADLVNNAIYIYMMEVTAIMAEAIGRNDLATILRDRHQKAKAEWNEVYVDPESGRTRNAQGTIVHSQTSYATLLNFNVFNDENIYKAQEYLAQLVSNPSSSNSYPDGTPVVYIRQARFPGSTIETRPVYDTARNNFLPYTITTGFSGTPNILPSLSRAGKTEQAYRLYTSADYTSWLYPVRMGATSVWERWNGYEAAFSENNQNSMNSFNHFALGSVGQWMYEYQLGITTDHSAGEAGYKHFVLQPQAGVKFVSLSGSYRSAYGEIISRWKADGKGNMTSFETVIPANTSATLYLPVNNSVQKFGNTTGATFIQVTRRNNITVAKYELTSGKFRFAISGNEVIAENFN